MTIQRKWRRLLATAGMVVAVAAGVNVAATPPPATAGVVVVPHVVAGHPLGSAGERTAYPPRLGSAAARKAAATRESFGPYYVCLNFDSGECILSNGNGNAATISNGPNDAKLTFTVNCSGTCYTVTNNSGYCWRANNSSGVTIFSSGACSDTNTNADWNQVSGSCGNSCYEWQNRGALNYAATNHTSNGSTVYVENRGGGDYYRWDLYSTSSETTAHLTAAHRSLWTCGAAKYDWAISSGVTPEFWYTQWDTNPYGCQQRSSGLCAQNPASSGHQYARGGWVIDPSIRSGAKCPGDYPFLRALWMDVRPNSSTKYIALKLWP